MEGEPSRPQGDPFAMQECDRCHRKVAALIQMTDQPDRHDESICKLCYEEQHEEPRPQGEGLPEALRQMLSNMAYGVSTMTEVERPLQEIERAIQQHAALVAEAAVRKCATDFNAIVDGLECRSSPIGPLHMAGWNHAIDAIRATLSQRRMRVLPPPQRETPDA